MPSPRHLLLLLVSSLAISPRPAVAQERSLDVGLVVVAHGAGAEWNARVRETVNQVSWRHGPTRVAFLMGPEAATASWDAAVAELQREGVRGLVVVPLMVSSHGSHTRQIHYFAGKLGALPAELAGHDHHGGHTPITVPIVVTTALDDAPELGEALIDRWQALPARDRTRPVVLIAHGPNAAADAVLWERDILATAGRLAQAVAPQPLRLGLLRDDAPAPVRAAAVAALRDTIAALSAAARDSVTVLPVLVSTGSINTVRIPADIGGLPVSYKALGLSPHPALARWVERVATGALTQLPVADVARSRSSLRDH